MKKTIIRKWYNRLSFSTNFDESFYSVLNDVDCENFTSIENYNADLHSPKENLCAYLYFCENLQTRYQEKGIPEFILDDTLHDLCIWTKVHYQVHGELGLSETLWLKRHLSFKLFKLGRLQYCINDSEFDIEDINLKKGDPIIEIHIPEGGALLLDKCQDSLKNAHMFFAKFFPEYDYEYYTCHSWLLDKKLLSLVEKNSNIALFQTMFHLRQSEVSDAVLKYVFRWDATRENLNNFSANSSLSRKIKAEIESKHNFHETLGFIAKNIKR